MFGAREGSVALGALNVSCCFYVHSASGEKDSSGVTTIPYFPPFNLALNTASYIHPTSPLTLPQIIGVQLLPTTPNSPPPSIVFVHLYLPIYLPVAPFSCTFYHPRNLNRKVGQPRSSPRHFAKAALPSLSLGRELVCSLYCINLALNSHSRYFAITLSLSLIFLI